MIVREMKDVENVDGETDNCKFVLQANFAPIEYAQAYYDEACASRM